jgi:hypothetical protein
MSSFSTVLIEDSRISSITSEEVFGVQSSASQSTYQQFQAVSTSNSSVVFNVQIPSENIVIDRHVYIQGQVLLTISCGNVPTGKYAMQYGLTDAFNCFPLQSLFTTMQMTINNASVSTNIGDIKDLIVRMNDKRMLNRYNSMTPSMPDDAYATYNLGVGANNNPLASYQNNSYDTDFLSRGSWKLDNFEVIHTHAGAPDDASLESLDPADTWTITIAATFTEPFLALSPFINCRSDNDAGLVGINNISANFNVDSSCKKVWNTANVAVAAGATPTKWDSYITGITLGSATTPTGLTNMKLLFNFLSLQPEQYAKISTKNIVGFLDYPRFLSPSTSNQTIAPNQTTTLISQSIQLSQVPDLILIAARIPLSQQGYGTGFTNFNAGSFLQINNISVNFNNASGLLASSTTNDLFELSIRNGSNQNYLEWSGASGNNNPANPLPYVPAGTGDAYPFTLGTTGSLLVLNPVYDFSLPSYLSASSLGQYQFQFNLTVTNQYPINFSPEIVVLTCNSGVFATVQGTSTIATGILTKDLVLKTKEENPVPHLDSKEYERLVGGKLIHRGMANVARMVRHRKRIKSALDGGAGYSGAGGIASGMAGLHHGVGHVKRSHPRLMKHLL